MSLNIIFELKKIILCTDGLKESYTHDFPNKKYTIDNILNEIVYFLKSGVSWRHLRSTINPKTLYWHFTKLVKFNIFGRLLDKLKTYYFKGISKIKGNNNNHIDLLIDTSVINNKNGINKLGRNKFYKNKRVTKLSLMTDINGFPISVLFMKGNFHDNILFHKHVTDAVNLVRYKTKRIIADKGFASIQNYNLLDTHKIKHIIPPRKNIKLYKSYIYDKSEYVKRIKIENIFGIIKTYKRINNRYDKLLRNFSAFVYLSLILVANNLIIKILKDKSLL